MGVASGCGEQEVGVASGSGWNLWVWLLGVVLRRYIDFLILLIPTPLVSVLFCSSIPTFLFIFKNVFRLYIHIYQRNAPANSSKWGSLRLAPISRCHHFHEVLTSITPIFLFSFYLLYNNNNNYYYYFCIILYYIILLFL